MSTPPTYRPPEDVLPTYNPTLSLYGITLIKVELTSPFECNNRRNWKPVVLEINGTKLNVYEIKDSKFSNYCWNRFTARNSFDSTVTDAKQEKNEDDLFESLSQKDYHNMTKKKLYSFTLQNSLIGSAKLDYNKRQNVLRLRVELVQLLIQCWNVNALIRWYYNLVWARELALPLDLRKPHIKSVPSIRYGELVQYEETPLSLKTNCAGTTHQGMCSSRSYSEQELEYILGCIPFLKAADKWSGKIVTISNYKKKLRFKSNLDKYLINGLNQNSHINCELQRKIGLDDVSIHIINDINKDMARYARNAGNKDSHLCINCTYLKRMKYDELENDCMDFYVHDIGLISVN